MTQLLESAGVLIQHPGWEYGPVSICKLLPSVCPEALGAQGGQACFGYLWTRAAELAGITPSKQFFFLPPLLQKSNLSAFFTRILL